jgi:hypothetical protein
LSLGYKSTATAFESDETERRLTDLRELMRDELDPAQESASFARIIS